MSKVSSRHAKPSAYILAARMDRKLNVMADLLKRTMKTLADDFTRVLRQNDTLRGENETLKRIIEIRDRLEVANAFISKPLPAPAAAKDIPTLRVVDVASAEPGPSESLPHIFQGSRCTRCGFLRAAIEASGTLCTSEAE